MSDNQFLSSLGLKLSPEQVVRTIIDFMAADPERAYKVIVGTDSQGLKAGQADFVTAIVVHRVGNGGRYFWRRTGNGKKYHTLRDRILEEVVISLDVAKEFIEAGNKFEVPAFDFEIHIDVGENGKTQPMIQELVGMIRANNFEARTKPDSYAATKVADRHT
jgi:uncharacterized protein